MGPGIEASCGRATRDLKVIPLGLTIDRIYEGLADKRLDGPLQSGLHRRANCLSERQESSHEHASTTRVPSYIRLRCGQRRFCDALRCRAAPLTCDEASQLLRVHPRTIKRTAARGEVPGHFRSGRLVFLSL
jgi:hypothetical protein